MVEKNKSVVLVLLLTFIHVGIKYLEILLHTHVFLFQTCIEKRFVFTSFYPVPLSSERLKTGVTHYNTKLDFLLQVHILSNVYNALTLLYLEAVTFHNRGGKNG